MNEATVDPLICSTSKVRLGLLLPFLDTRPPDALVMPPEIPQPPRPILRHQPKRILVSQLARRPHWPEEVKVTQH